MRLYYALASVLWLWNMIGEQMVLQLTVRLGAGGQCLRGARPELIGSQSDECGGGGRARKNTEPVLDLAWACMAWTFPLEIKKKLLRKNTHCPLLVPAVRVFLVPVPGLVEVPC